MTRPSTEGKQGPTPPESLHCFTSVIPPFPLLFLCTEGKVTSPAIRHFDPHTQGSESGLLFLIFFLCISTYISITITMQDNAESGAFCKYLPCLSEFEFEFVSSGRRPSPVTSDTKRSRRQLNQLASILYVD